jgi:hypothetical protein
MNSADQLNILKTQEEILKNAIKALEAQKERLVVEEADLVNLIEFEYILNY